MPVHTPLGRRALLRGAGTAIALPLLDAMIPRLASAQAKTPPRFVAMFHSAGTVPKWWVPAAAGPDFPLSRILMPLAEVKNHVTVLSGMGLAPAGAATPGTHNNQRCVLTAANTIRPGATDSIDQAIAQRIGQQTRFDTLQLTIEQNTFYDPAKDANKDGFKDSPSPSFDDTKDYCTKGEECRVGYLKGASVPNFYNPRLVFERLFGAMAGAPGGGMPGSPDDMTAARRRVALKKSSLDVVKDDVARLKRKLGPADNIRLDEYLAGLRKLELAIPDVQAMPAVGTAPTKPSVGCGAGVKPPGIPHLDQTKHARFMADLIVKAFQCDATRVVTLMLGQNQSQMPFTIDGQTYRHHLDASHWNTSNKPNAQDAKAQIDVWQVSQLAYLMAQMKAVAEPGGTMLDNTVLYYSSEIDDGQGHGSSNMPVLLCGGGGGKLKTGQHLKMPGRFPGEIFLTLLREIYGADVSTFGEWGPKPLAGLV